MRAIIGEFNKQTEKASRAARITEMTLDNHNGHHNDSHRPGSLEKDSHGKSAGKVFTRVLLGTASAKDRGKED